MAFKSLRVGETEFVLPEGKLATIFENQGNVSILEPDPKGAFKGWGVIDSVHTRGSADPRQKEAKVVALLRKHGATEINPNSAVA